MDVKRWEVIIEHDRCGYLSRFWNDKESFCMHEDHDPNTDGCTKATCPIKHLLTRPDPAYLKKKHDKLIRLLSVCLGGYTKSLQALQVPYETYIPPTEDECIRMYQNEAMFAYAVNGMAALIMQKIIGGPDEH